MKPTIRQLSFFNENAKCGIAEEFKKEIRSTTATPALGMTSIPNSKLRGMTSKKMRNVEFGIAEEFKSHTDQGRKATAWSVSHSSSTAKAVPLLPQEKAFFAKNYKISA